MLTLVVSLALHLSPAEDVERLEQTLVMPRGSAEAVASMGRRLLNDDELARAFSTVPAAEELAARARDQKGVPLPLAIAAGIGGGAGVLLGRFVSLWLGLGFGVVAVALLVVATVFAIVSQATRMRAIWTWNRAQREALGDSPVARRVAAEWIGPCEDGSPICRGDSQAPEVEAALRSEPAAKALLEASSAHSGGGLILSLLGVLLDSGAAALGVIGGSLISLPLIVIGVVLLVGGLVVTLVGLGQLQQGTEEAFDAIAAWDSALLSRLRREPAAPGGVTLLTF